MRYRRATGSSCPTVWKVRQSAPSMAWLRPTKAEAVVTEPERQLVRITNPSALPAEVTLRSTDASGAFLALEEVTVARFAHLDISIRSTEDSRVSRVVVTSNADVLVRIDEVGTTPSEPRHALDPSEEHWLELVIESEQSIGAYQVTLRFDPSLIRFSTNDITAGSSPGFDTKPLVVGVDNVAGELTIGCFRLATGPVAELSWRG